MAKLISCPRCQVVWDTEEIEDQQCAACEWPNPDTNNDDGWDPDDLNLDDDCPNCGKAYDTIDHEYQICHHCKYNNSK